MKSIFQPSNNSEAAPSQEDESHDAPKLSFWTKAAYGAGTVGVSMTGNILVFFVLFFFTDVAGLSAALGSSLLTIGKLADAISDPAIGLMSDRTQSRWGRRFPWMIVGVIPFGISFALLWFIPPWGEWGLFAYFAVLAVIFNISYTAIFLPYVALTPELTQDYNERTRVNSFRFTFAISSSILALAIANQIFQHVDDARLQYLILGGIATAIAFITMAVCIWGTWKPVMRIERTRPKIAATQTIPLRQQFQIVLSNRPFLLVMGIYLCSWLTAQMTAVIMQYFVVSWMELSSTVFTQFALVVQGTALLMLFVWSAACRRFGKRAVYFMGMGLWLMAQIGLFFLQPGQVMLLFALGGLAGFGISTAYLVPWSMLPDVIELDELKTGQRREGLFYAFMVMLQKLGIAIGLFLVGQALSWAGYVERVPGQPVPVQPESALWVIRLVIGPLGAVILVCGLVFAAFYPITQQVHTEILMKLQRQRRSRESS
jgi:GPH family glycoside/pentoside/hexuronide:cation symporter